ncbi:hypothetical protein [Nocardia nova]|uniref:hypothetical protein n=1 Tax=Nocardia nova TaxID=37330 RepID=UPI0034104359
MAQPTPWGSSDASTGGPDPSVTAETVSPRTTLPQTTPSASGRFLLRLRPETLRQSWAACCAILAGVVTLVLLFRPWATASGPDGRVRTDAFGRVQASTTYLSAWSRQHSGIARISGGWALLAAAAIVVMVVLALVTVGKRTELAARCTAISAVVVAVLVLITLVYVSTKTPDLKAMTARKYDMGGQIGSLMAWAFGNGTLAIPGVRQSTYSSGGLAPSGMVACGLSVIAAVAAVTQWLHDYPVGRIHLRLRSPLVRTAAESNAVGEPPAADPPESGA